MAYRGHIVFLRDCEDSVYIMGSEWVMDNTYSFFNFLVKNLPSSSPYPPYPVAQEEGYWTLLYCPKFFYSSWLLLTLGVKSYSDPIITLPLWLDGWCHLWEGSWSPQYCTLRGDRP